VKRVSRNPKAESAEVAMKFGKDYWMARGAMATEAITTMAGGVLSPRIADHYKFEERGSSIDVAAKRSLLYEFTQVIPGAKVAGLDISTYAVENAKEEISNYPSRDAAHLP